VTISANTLTVTGGLTLDGTLNLGAASGSTSSGQVTFKGSQMLEGTGKVVLGGSTSNALYAQGDNGNNPAKQTVGSSITIQGGSGIISGVFTSSSTDTVALQGTISVPGGQTLLIGGSN
jgi:hypothetical protein